MGVLTRIAHSFATKLVILLAIFVALPFIVYSKFQDAYEERAALLLSSIQEEGHLVARALRPLLETFQGSSAQDLVAALNRIGTGQTRIKLLFQPRDPQSPESFYYVAAVPDVDTGYLEQEQTELTEQGIFGKLPETCEGGRPLAQRYVNPDGGVEVLTSITPVEIHAGCWVVITSRASEDVLSSAFGQPYWKTPEVRIAAVIYVVMAVIVLSMFLGIWRNIRRFAEHARDIRKGKSGGQSFASLNHIPELTNAADEFDHLVDALHQSASRIRQAAEENAHALKAPLAVISQSIEPLKAAIPASDTRRRRAADLVERSVAKLDVLISAARRVDEVSAALIDPVRKPVVFSGLVKTMVRSYAAVSSDRSPRVEGKVEPRLVVNANEEVLETVVENLLDNAVSFSPPSGNIRVALAKNGRDAVLTIEDEGPGVSPEMLSRIFDRYFSHRPAQEPASDADPATEPSSHFGIGLWVARRNVEALGGTIDAENSENQGLRVVIRLPLAA